MDKIASFIENNFTKWRRVMPKLQYCEEFGKLDEAEIELHNISVMNNYNELMDIFKKIDDIDLENITVEEDQFLEDVAKKMDTYTEKDLISII